MTLTKDPDATLDYGVNWRPERLPWLSTGESIVSSSWLVPDGTVTVLTESHTDTTTTVWLSGGTLGQLVNLVNRITTDQGRTEDRTICLRIKNH